MKTQKTKITNRKFYNKWLYKASLKIIGANVFRRKDLHAIEELCLADENPTYSFEKAYSNKDTVLRLASLLRTFDQTLWAKRIENCIIDFYTNDKDIHNKIVNNFADNLVQQFSPCLDHIDVLINAHSTILAKQLPHKMYNYKVYLCPHKMANDLTGKKKYTDWLKTQRPRVTCTDSICNWFLSTNWNWDRRYILVENEAMLLMLQLKNSEVVGRIYNYQLCDK